MALAGCAAAPVGGCGAGVLEIGGALAHRERIALPPDSVAIVELRDAAAPEGASVAAEQRFALEGRQVPLPFTLRVERVALEPQRTYRVRGGVLVGGRPAWASEPVAVDVRAPGPLDVGTLWMRPVQFLAFASTFRCGDREVRLGIGEGDRLRMTVGAEGFDVREVPVASGAKFEAVGDPATFLWNKGDQATLQVRGAPFPQCLRAGAAPSPLRAIGHEPGWRVDLDEARLTLLADTGARRIEAAAPVPERLADGWRFAARADAGPLAVTVTERRCADVATGMPHPYTVAVDFEGRTLRGCGGDPAALLVGDWRVATIDGEAIGAARDAVTLRFAPDGVVGGQGPCNPFGGGWALGGEGLALTRLAATTMACPAPLMRAESRLLALLAGVQRFEIGADGALVLVAGDGRLVARRP